MIRDMFSDPAVVIAALLHGGCLAVVGRWRLLGWCLGGLSGLALVAYGVLADRPGFLLYLISLVMYGRLIVTRWRESWRAIPAPAELGGTPCTRCCVHGNGGFTVRLHTADEYARDTTGIWPADWATTVIEVFRCPFGCPGEFDRRGIVEHLSARRHPVWHRQPHQVDL